MPSRILTTILPTTDKIVDNRTRKLRTAFAVYSLPEAPAPVKPRQRPPKNTLIIPDSRPVSELHAAQIKKMDPSGARTALFAKEKTAVRVGDVLLVTHRRGGEPFAGVLLAIRRRGIETSILLRNHLGKVPVEMWYKIYNKNVASIDVIKKRAKRARRAKLTYMRKPKHDMGSLQELVFEWRRTRRALSSRGSSGVKGKKGQAKRR
jgi:large subunit ribosomal protein L19